MEQSTSDGSIQTTDPLPESDDPIPTEHIQELDNLFENKAPHDSSGFAEDFFETPERLPTLSHGSHERASLLEHHHVLRLWRG